MVIALFPFVMESNASAKPAPPSAYAPVPAGPGGSAAAPAWVYAPPPAASRGAHAARRAALLPVRLRVPAARLSTAGAVHRYTCVECSRSVCSNCARTVHALQLQVKQPAPLPMPAGGDAHAAGAPSTSGSACLRCFTSVQEEMVLVARRDWEAHRYLAARPQGEQDVGSGPLSRTAAVSAVVGAVAGAALAASESPRSRRHRGRRTRDTGGMATVGAVLVPQPPPASRSPSSVRVPRQRGDAPHADEYEAFGRRISAAETEISEARRALAGARGVGASLLRVRPGSRGWADRERARADRGCRR